MRLGNRNGQSNAASADGLWASLLRYFHREFGAARHADGILSSHYTRQFEIVRLGIPLLNRDINEGTVGNRLEARLLSMLPLALRSTMGKILELLAHSWEVALAPHAEAGRFKLRFRGAVFARVLRRELEAQHGKPTLVIPPLEPEALPRGDRPRVVHVIDGILVGGPRS